MRVANLPVNSDSCLQVPLQICCAMISTRIIRRIIGGNGMKYFSGLLLALVVGAGCTAAFAQKVTDNGIEIEKNLELMRRDLRSEKKKIIAVNVPFTDTEATKFWPVYDQYAADMTKHYDAFYLVIKDYAANQKTLTDDQALKM